MEPSLCLDAHGDFFGGGIVGLRVGHLQHLLQARAQPREVNLEYIEDLLGDTLAGIAE